MKKGNLYGVVAMAGIAATCIVSCLWSVTSTPAFGFASLLFGAVAVWGICGSITEADRSARAASRAMGGTA